MGAELVGLVSAKWAHIRSISQYKILVRMAWTSLDRTQGPDKPAAHYYAGWQVLAAAMGRELPNDDDYSKKAVARRKTIRDEVIRSTAALEALGAIKPVVENPARRTRQVWKLTL